MLPMGMRILDSSLDEPDFDSRKGLGTVDGVADFTASLLLHSFIFGW